MSHTFATLELSAAAYNEIREKLKAAGYDHAFHDDGHLDLHGLAANTEHEAGCYSKPYPEGRGGPCGCGVMFPRLNLAPLAAAAALALKATESAAAEIAQLDPSEVAPLATRLERLERFKEYVHARLDQMNVPTDPEPQANAAHGCRIEGRLNWLLDQMIEAEDKAETLEAAAAKLRVPPDLFVLKKRGAWWRPKACGYADGILYAGTYTRAEAESYVNGASGEVTMFPLEEAIADSLGPWGSIDQHTLRAAFAHEAKRGGS